MKKIITYSLLFLAPFVLNAQQKPSTPTPTPDQSGLQNDLVALYLNAIWNAGSSNKQINWTTTSPVID